MRDRLLEKESSGTMGGLEVTDTIVHGDGDGVYL